MTRLCVYILPIYLFVYSGLMRWVGPKNVEINWRHIVSVTICAWVCVLWICLLCNLHTSWLQLSLIAAEAMPYKIWSSFYPNITFIYHKYLPFTYPWSGRTQKKKGLGLFSQRTPSSPPPLPHDAMDLCQLAHYGLVLKEAVWAAEIRLKWRGSLWGQPQTNRLATVKRSHGRPINSVFVPL